MQKGLFLEDSTDRVIPVEDYNGKELRLNTTYTYVPKGEIKKRKVRTGRRYGESNATIK